MSDSIVFTLSRMYDLQPAVYKYYVTSEGLCGVSMWITLEYTDCNQTGCTRVSLADVNITQSTGRSMLMQKAKAMC
jgi:hypothetical protein